MVLAVIGIQVTGLGINKVLGDHDEGLLVTDGFNIARGLAPYRDFYTQYPPGSLVLVRAFMALFPGYAVYVMRAVAFGSRIAGAALAAAVVGRLTDRRARVATFAAVLLVQSNLDLTMFSYVTAVTLALAGLLAFPTERSSTGRYAACGVLLGLISWFRHDLFAYASVAFLVEALVAWGARRPLGVSLPRAGRLAWALGLVATLLVFWGPVFVIGGPSATFHDLFLDQVRYVQPARAIPLPSFKEDASVGLFNWTVPVYLTDYVRLGLLALGAGIAAGAMHFAWLLRRARVPEDERIVVGLLLAFAAGAAPQALQRVDWAHVSFGVPLTVASLFGAVGGFAAVSEVLLVVAFLPFVATTPKLTAWKDFASDFKPRPDETFFRPEHIAASQALRKLAGPDDRIFVGCTSHARVVIGRVGLYFESGRLGATRVQQFDPGIVTRDDVQREMIEQIKEHHPPVLALTPSCSWAEPNDSVKLGSHLLDRYIVDNYMGVDQVGGFRILVPR
jgi:hypothetical protein